MLSIVVTDAPGLVVTRDGTVVDPGVYGVPVPVDGGEHTIGATAPGKSPMSEKITVAAEADKKTYRLMPLVDAPSQAPAASTDAAAPTSDSGGLSTRAIAGIVIAGAGVVIAGVGGYFGATALSKKSDSAPYCGADGQKDDCYGQGVQLRKDAVSDATISTVLFGVGAAAVIGGVVLWITAPSSKTSATVGFDGRMLHLGGTF
jgi:hypothetical protein